MTDEDADLSVPRPRRALERAYLESLEARFLWLEEASKGFPTATREELHGILHAKTMSWFEALYPFLSDREQVEKYWEDVELWPLGYKTEVVDGVECPDCDHQEPATETVQPGDVCLNCGDTYLDGIALEVVVQDDDGEPVIEYERGLQTLEEWQDRTTTETYTVGTFQTKTRTVERPVRLTPDILLRANRLLDQAAEKLGLLADVEISVPTTEVDEETLADARDHIEQIVEEFGDDGGYEGASVAGGDD